MIYKQRDKGGLALLPFIIFIVIYLGAGIYFQHMGVEMAFYQFPSVTAMFLAVIAAFCMGMKISPLSLGFLLAEQGMKMS